MKLIKFFFHIFIIASPTFGMQSESYFLPNLVVVKDAVIEMNNSFPPPAYHPLSPETKGCKRAHQALYNEVAECLEYAGDSVKIVFDKIIYGYDPEKKVIQNTFWTLKKFIISFEHLKENVLNQIPIWNYAEKPTIVLIYPWKNFSVGTRFMHQPYYDTADSYAIMWADYITQKTQFDFVPRIDAIQEIKQDLPHKRKLFVTIINNLIDRLQNQQKVIPYVWGGSSFVNSYKDAEFYLKDGVWEREGKNDPYTGYDCSELVMRMAQIVGLDFPWKTSTAIQRALKEVDHQDTIENGDLIWVPGHVMIISDVQKNELIESRGYSSGFGCAHRITLKECFNNINTYNDLLEYHRKNLSVQFKDKTGKVLEKTYTIKILKLI